MKPDAALSAPPRNMGQSGDFASELRLAIQKRGISLERIRARLVERGTPVSLATLSYWQSGRSQPERPGSLRAVESLEQILRVPAGSLMMLLGAPRRRGRAAQNARPRVDGRSVVPQRALIQATLQELNVPWMNGLTRISLHDRLEIGPDRGERTMMVRQIVKAERDGVTGAPLVFIQDSVEDVRPSITAVSNCTLGDVGVWPDLHLMVAELRFNRTLNLGESIMIEFMVTSAPTEVIAYRHERRCTVPTREVMFEIRFHPDAIPSHLERYEQVGDLESVSPVSITGNIVQILNTDFGPGTCGVRWTW